MSTSDLGVSVGLSGVAENLTKFVARFAYDQGWRLTRQRIAHTYGGSWWRLVYAATPTFRFEREGGVEPLPIEAEACEAAIDQMVAAGVLVR